MKEKDKILKHAKALAEKFVGKVEEGTARSVETCRECKELLVMMEKEEKSHATNRGDNRD